MTHKEGIICSDADEVISLPQESEFTQNLSSVYSCPSLSILHYTALHYTKNTSERSYFTTIKSLRDKVKPNEYFCSQRNTFPYHGLNQYLDLA